METGCVFCKIARGELPAKFVYKDEFIVGFESIEPKAPVHWLFIPRKHIPDLVEAEDDIIVRMKKVISDTVSERGLSERGYRVVVNGGRAKQIPHLHFHFLGEVALDREV